ncbi:hypothetical protein CBR_g42097 [Chara braunii]|uniref:G8 domain-containing protein n=1 Tax=Chara braunii TaxID=69332 RepID=A0A388LWW5_CHABU|nr:hypothetical protein CBR_g42097 [Chara braunii]|eukprot:GBG86814.1 hypothetical protein CBR_g42097 [Chara braunii]
MVDSLPSVVRIETRIESRNWVEIGIGFGGKIGIRDRIRVLNGIRDGNRESGAGSRSGSGQGKGAELGSGTGSGLVTEADLGSGTGTGAGSRIGKESEDKDGSGRGNGIRIGNGGGDEDRIDIGIGSGRKIGKVIGIRNGSWGEIGIRNGIGSKLDDFLKLVEERWHDPQEAQKATDAILTLSSIKFRCEAAFRHLKHSLTHHEVLKLHDPDNPFIVTTDANQYGIGVVLAQQEGLKLRPVEYLSKKIPSQKLAKFTYEKELYAIYKSLTHWRHYLLGRFFYVRTDHQPLKWMRTQPVLSDALLKRCIEVIEQYDFEPQYIKGEYNKVADALSCRPNFLGALITEFGLVDDVTRSLADAYREDPFMAEIIRRLEAKDKVTSDEFVLVNGLLFLENAGNKRLCVPNRESLRSLFLGECHDATGHFGYKKTAANLLQQFWWPTMRRDSKLYVETCQVCQRDKPRTQAPLGLLKPLPVPERPSESLSMDFMDTLVSSKSGMRYVYVILDRFSKYASSWLGSQTVPAPGDSVYIPPGESIYLDVVTPHLELVVVEGSLLFDDMRDVGLTAKYIVVRKGLMQVGLPNAPYTHKAVITMTCDVDCQEIPIYGSKVLALRDGTLQMHGLPKIPSWTRLDGTVYPGDTMLTLAEPVNWQEGDEIAIAASNFDHSEVDTVTILSIRNGKTVTFEPPLKYEHIGYNMVLDGKVIDTRAEVAVLTRNVVFQGDEDSENDLFGGSIMMHSVGDNNLTAQLSNVEIRRAGEL